MNKDMETKVNSYLSFKLGEETFAANVSQILNILEMVKITEVPKTPKYMKGIINLRGEVLPVIDTRLKFGMKPIEVTKNTCILVLEIKSDSDTIKIGAMVDSVVEVLEMEESQIKPPPQINQKSLNSFIKGMIKNEENFIILLDVNKVFSSSELVKLDESKEEINKKVEEESLQEE